jgi:hypothetical protein
MIQIGGFVHKLYVGKTQEKVSMLFIFIAQTNKASAAI